MGTMPDEVSDYLRDKKATIFFNSAEDWMGFLKLVGLESSDDIPGFKIYNGCLVMFHKGGPFVLHEELESWRRKFYSIRSFVKYLNGEGELCPS